ncbi:Uncharacterised protein [uncultured archaeon]|nr:Uncharacterised protein [uncultured archaeon]
MELEHKATIAIIAIFLLCLAIEGTISGMQVAPGQGQPGCVDSDGGMNPNVQGAVDRTLDYCLNENVLMEQTCQGPQRYTCPNGCRNGACAQPLRLVKKEQPALNQQLIRVVQEEQRQREQAQQRRQQCTDECNRAANICNNICDVPLFYPICTRDCNTVKQRCIARC